jgi:hemoglobin-like flavoprotein
MTCFILTATNVVLVLHLAEHHNDKNHDPEHCPICQQAIVNAVKAVLPDTSVIKEPPQVTIADVYIIQHFVKDFKFLTPHTRAPPAVS